MEVIAIVKTSETKQLQLDRACLYTFFSRLFTDHTTAGDLGQYMSFLETVGGEYKSIGYGLQKVIKDWSERDSADNSLKTEYARLFIIAGGIRPYESVYLGNEPLLMREPWLQVKEFYRRGGVVLEKPAAHPEDHASVELSFMAHMIETGGDVMEQKTFFEEHIYQWLPQMLNELIEHQHACFFKEMATYGLNFIEQEKKLFALINDEVKTESDQRSDE